MVLTTVPDRGLAGRLASSAVEARLAACAQIVGPIESVYRWEGAVETAQEWQIWFKTTTARYDELVAHVIAEHPYQVPEILCLPIADGHPPYLAWIREETSLDLPPGSP